MKPSTKIFTLLLLRREGELLLAIKKLGLGVDRWNGFGGKVEPGETVEAAMIRETKEEVGITPVTYEKVAEIHAEEYSHADSVDALFHVFMCSNWEGEPSESNEMIKPQWFKDSDIPYNEMWPDDAYWLPTVLAGKKIIADFQLDASDAIVSHSMKEVVGFEE